MKNVYIFFTVLFPLAGFLISAILIGNENSREVDLLALNRIEQSVAASWNSLAEKDLGEFLYDFSILDSSGTLVYRTAENTSVNLHEAYRNNDIIIDILPDSTVAGKILVSTKPYLSIAGLKLKLSVSLIFLFLLWALFSIIFIWYLDKNIFRPFGKLKRFAKNIALGNLSFPLEMNKNNLFGSFTESFDLMRCELDKAKRKEELANQSKKELVASLSHDIKTPITSIKLITEFMLVTAPGEFHEKLQTIYNKSEQIDHLITNMFQSTLEDLGELKVNLIELQSTDLEEILITADYDNKIKKNPIPGCILYADLLRLEQVIDNIINNSYKYASTDITVDCSISDRFLKIGFLDYGKGVRPEELDHLFDKFYRGSNAGRLAGSGLGLYISQYLMSRMNGEILCENRSPGFYVSLLIPLA